MYADARNIDAVVLAADSPEDIYKHNPWRAPGSAPVGNACGFAGGTPWLPEGPEAGDYTTTKYAHHGMAGTELKPLPTGSQATWTIGGTAEVTWQVDNNHGGGYAYRLCPAGDPLTEACFQQNHLDFVPAEQSIVFPNGSMVNIADSAVFVDEGTTPAGSMWSMIPFPTDALGPRCIPGDMHCCLVLSPRPAARPRAFARSRPTPLAIVCPSLRALPPIGYCFPDFNFFPLRGRTRARSLWACACVRVFVRECAYLCARTSVRTPISSRLT